MDRVITELQAGRTEKAIAGLDEFIKKNPNNPDAYLLRGSLKMQTDPAQALRDFDKVIELKPEFDVLLQSDRALWQKRIDDRIAAVKKLLPVK